MSGFWQKARDPFFRAFRVFFMAWAGVFLFFVSNEIIRFTDSAYVPDYELWKRAVVAGCAAGFVALVAFGQNFLEDNTTTALLNPTRSLKNKQREMPASPNTEDTNGTGNQG